MADERDAAVIDVSGPGDDAPEGPPMPLHDEASPPSGTDPTASRRSRWIAAAIVAVLAVLAIVAVEIVHNIQPTEIPTGPGTATITWSTSGATRPVSGTAGGLGVTGVATPAKSPFSSGQPTFPSSRDLRHIPIATVTGSLGGHSFTIHIVLSFDVPSTLTNKSVTLGHVTGTFRGQPVEAKLTANLSASTLLHFSGTIAGHRVAGVIHEPRTHGTTTVAHASFDVTG
jgi:hypothetical protein